MKFSVAFLVFLQALFLPVGPASASPKSGPLPRVRPPEKPIIRESALDRRTAYVEKIAKEMQAAGSPGTGIQVLNQHFQETLSARFRLMLLDLLVKRPGPETDDFLVRVLESDVNAAVRQRAATMLGFQGGKDCAKALAKASLEDPVTRHIGGCKNVDQSARAAAKEALARLRTRFEVPKAEDEHPTGWIR